MGKSSDWLDYFWIDCFILLKLGMAKICALGVLLVLQSDSEQGLSQRQQDWSCEDSVINNNNDNDDDDNNNYNDNDNNNDDDNDIFI